MRKGVKSLYSFFIMSFSYIPSSCTHQFPNNPVLFLPSIT
jgi:hypothetical protein